MSDINPPSSPSSRRFGCGRAFLWFILVGSLLLNIALCGFLGFRHADDDVDLKEKRLWGDDDSKDKVAVIRIEGVLMDGMTGYYTKQIEQAAKDEHVIAIVVRIDSPGGTVSASEEIYRLLIHLREGTVPKHPTKKPKKMIVSMGAIAASGGYYVAMPAEKIFAEQITLTGSIGVYASLPNVAGFIKEHGIKFELIKAGGIKAGGSPFHELTPQERQPWQDMVDASYDHFLDVVIGGRPKFTKENLSKDMLIQGKVFVYDGKGNVALDWLGQPQQVDYVRRRADGGTFTAKEALKYGLVDEIGTLDDAVKAAADAAKLSKYQTIEYEKPSTILSLLGISARTPKSAADPHRLAQGTTPRLWYLAPQSDLAGILSAMGRD